MISNNLSNLLNEQIQREFSSAYLYLGMSCHFESVGLAGFASWMHEQAKEEMEHAMKIYHFLFEIGAKPILKAIPEVKVSYDAPKSVVEMVLKHEEGITKSINDLYQVSLDEHDFKTMNFLSWFVNEQVEEEANVHAILDKFKYCENNSGLLLIDHLLSKRAMK